MTQAPHTQQLTPRQRNEYGLMRHVVMARLQGLDDTTFSELDDPSLERQMQQFEFDFADYDADKARAEHDAFIELMRREGVHVHLASAVPNCFTQYGTRDQGFTIDDTFYFARPRRAYRQRELEGLNDVAERLTRTARLASGTIEGGDVMLLGEDVVLVGRSEETDAEGVNALRAALAQHGSARAVRPLEFAINGVIHLDTLLSILSPDKALIYEPAFTPADVDFLRERLELIPVTWDEVKGAQANVLRLGDRRVVVTRASERLAHLLSQHGFDPILIDYDEVNKFPGSVRCTTLPLVRDDV